jgi:predicted DsbA family dithiol-disulfide isomerase
MTPQGGGTEAAASTTGAPSSHPLNGPAEFIPRGGLTVWADIACPWATVVLHRLVRERDRRGLDLMIDLRAYPLELVNGRPTPRAEIDGDIAALAAMEPDLGMAPWSADPDTYPVTSLPALEAVRAATSQGAEMGLALDSRLRRAFFAEHRCISILPIITDCAEECEGLDVGRLLDEMRTGPVLGDVLGHLDQATHLGVVGSPHVALADGSGWFAPSLETDGDDGDSVRDVPEEIDMVLDAAATLVRGD